MMTKPIQGEGKRSEEVQPARANLPSAAIRALEEAEARRAAATAAQSETAREIGGRGGKEPVRYGDWEVGGKAVDF